MNYRKTGNPVLDKLRQEDAVIHAFLLRGEIKPTGQVYFFQGKLTRRIKIGHTRGLSHRTGSIQANSPDDLELLATMEGNRELERALHAQFSQYRIRDEWFKPVDKLLEYISNIQEENRLDSMPEEEVDKENAAEFARIKGILRKHGVCWTDHPSGSFQWHFLPHHDKKKIHREIYPLSSLVSPLVVKERLVKVRADDLTGLNTKPEEESDE